MRAPPTNDVSRKDDLRSLDLEFLSARLASQIPRAVDDLDGTLRRRGRVVLESRPWVLDQPNREHRSSVSEAH